ncbi:hypothetical protein B484DRAFT_409980, partial [Ochromonadaceae sp. CCMP2298]
EPEALAVVHSLSEQIQLHPHILQRLKSKELSMALWGLQSQSQSQSQSHSHSRGRELVPEVARLLSQINDALDIRLAVGTVPVHSRGNTSENRLSESGPNGSNSSSASDSNRSKRDISNSNINSNSGNGTGSRPNTVEEQFRFQKGEELGLLLGGVRGMSADHAEVRRLLRHVTTIAQNTAWQYQEVRNRNKDAVVGRVRDRDRDLGEGDFAELERGMGIGGGGGRGPEWRRRGGRRVSLAPINQYHVTLGLYGLQGMSDEHTEVRGLVACLSAIIRTRVKGAFCGETMAKAMYGLQSMQGSREVRELLRVLESRFDPLGEDYTGQHVAMCCYGLRSMSVRGAVTDMGTGTGARLSVDLERLLLFIGAQVASPLNAHHIFTPAHIATAVFGLQGVLSSPAARSLLQELGNRFFDSLSG